MPQQPSPHPELDALVQPLARTLRASVVQVVEYPGGTVGIGPIDDALQAGGRAPGRDHALLFSAGDWHVAVVTPPPAERAAPPDERAAPPDERAAPPDDASGSRPIVVVARQGEAWDDGEIQLLESFLGVEPSNPATRGETVNRRDLDDLVTRVAVSLMSVSVSTFTEALVSTCQELEAYFDVDTAFIRRHDQEAGVSILVAEWPPRPNVPDPDPLGVVPFEADPTFAMSRHQTEPVVLRPTPEVDAYQERVRDASGIPQVSLASVPLLSEGDTTGILGLIKFGDRPWALQELGALKAIASLLVQVFARVAAEERLSYHALHDELTGLANRRHLIEHLRRRLAPGGDRPLAVILLDLDRFKATNDTLGHAVGDRLLRQVAKRLLKASRPDDLVARLGGDEFVVVPRGSTDIDDAVALAERIGERLAKPLQLGGHHLTRTASLGVAVAVDNTSTAEELISQADVALRAAKAAGGSSALVFDEGMRRSVEERSDMEFMLRDAIDSGGLTLHYQPEFDLRTGNFIGVEALIRWHHPTRGLLDANDFIGVAEDSNLVIDIGRLVLLEACKQMAEWKSYWAGTPFLVRVNVSPAQLSSRELVDLVRFSLLSNGLPGETLCLEVTEHAMMTDIERSVDLLHELRGLGVSLAIDDFGTGFSSLAQLKRLPVNTLKIDRAFVTGVDTDRSNRAIVQSMIQLADTFQLDIVAEGVETVEEARELLKLGCRRVQGYLFSRPKRPEEIVEYFGQSISTPFQLVG